MGDTISLPIPPNVTGEEWYQHFSSLHKENNDSDINTNFLENNPNLNNISRELDNPFSLDEFQTVIKNLKCNKAEGYDSILNEMIKHAPPIILDLVLKYINLCFDKSLISQSWCLDIITAIHKEGSTDDPNNYRGISISSALLKLVSSLLHNRIEAYCSKLNIINKNQIGFRPNHRTSDHLLTLKAVVKKYVTMGQKKLFGCFVDFKKAFDSVWHEGLFYKMRNIGIGGKTLGLITDIYKKTKCAVKSKNSLTLFFDYQKGVRQGCPLSPILFNIYVNDIFETINNDNDSDIFLDEKENKINMLMYADDLIILSDSKAGLQKQLDKLENYCSKWKLKINNKKTKVIIFNRGNKLINTEFYLKQSKLENVKEFKYLGLKISAKNCSFLPIFRDLSIKATRVIYVLNNKIKLSMLPTKLALKLFNSLISPILLYGSEVWGPYANFDFADWDKSNIEQVHIQFIKRVLGCNFRTSNIMSRGEVGQRPLLTNIIRRTISYIQNIQKRKDSLVFKAWAFELNNNITPNFATYINKFHLNINEAMGMKKYAIKKSCHENYDRFWKTELERSPKAVSYKNYKNNIYFESYLQTFKDVKLRIGVSRFRLSNHNLMIEKGRHFKPKLDKNERKCYLCKNPIENEEHFLVNCPLFTPQRIKLEIICKENCERYDNLTQEQKFIFIMSNEDPKVTMALGKFVSHCLLFRENFINYFFLP